MKGTSIILRAILTCMKIYFDTCSLQRPLDDRTQLRVVLEAEAILAVLALCESGTHTLVSSDVLRFEIGRTPHQQRRAFGLELLEQTSLHVLYTDTIEQQAEALEKHGIKAFDALHLASAVAAQADYFCSCDDRLLKKARLLPMLLLRIVSRLELAQEMLP